MLGNINKKLKSLNILLNIVFLNSEYLRTENLVYYLYYKLNLMYTLILQFYFLNY